MTGTTLAYWLARHGFAATVVERGAQQRSSGNPIDVEGQAVTIRRASGSRSIELGRADLARILYERARDEADFRYGEAVSSLAESRDGVDITFESGAQERFELVIGADGLHSGIRRLAFGSESRFVSHLGLHVASMALEHTAHPGRDVVMHNAPGRLTTISPTRDGAVGFFAFRSPPFPGRGARPSGTQARPRRSVRRRRGSALCRGRRKSRARRDPDGRGLGGACPPARARRLTNLPKNDARIRFEVFCQTADVRLRRALRWLG